MRQFGKPGAWAGIAALTLVLALSGCSGPGEADGDGRDAAEPAARPTPHPTPGATATPGAKPTPGTKAKGGAKTGPGTKAKGGSGADGSSGSGTPGGTGSGGRGSGDPGGTGDRGGRDLDPQAVVYGFDLPPTDENVSLNDTRAYRELAASVASGDCSGAHAYFDGLRPIFPGAAGYGLSGPRFVFLFQAGLDVCDGDRGSASVWLARATDAYGTGGLAPDDRTECVLYRALRSVLEQRPKSDFGCPGGVVPGWKDSFDPFLRDDPLTLDVDESLPLPAEPPPPPAAPQPPAAPTQSPAAPAEPAPEPAPAPAPAPEPEPLAPTRLPAPGGETGDEGTPDGRSGPVGAGG